jgi:hypothetical protein
LELRGDGLTVTDMVEGTGEHEVEIFFHFHPRVEPEITLDPKLSKSREETMYHPGFNLSIPNTTIVGRFKGAAPLRVPVIHTSASKMDPSIPAAAHSA